MEKLDYKILYVEDEDKIRTTMEKIFSMFFNTVYTAENGKIGAEIFEEHQDIDIIISDIEMPQLSGIDMVARIREINKDVPVFITSAYPEVKYKDRIENLAITKYFVKPTRFNVLIEEVKSQLGITA